MAGEKSNNVNNTISFEQLQAEFNQFERIDLTDTSHQQALLELFPEYLLIERNNIDWQLFCAMSRYDRRNKTFITGCFDNTPLEFKLISYKWSYKDGIKWKTKAGTSPNKTLFIRVFTDDAPIYVIEGHRDALTAVLLGLNFVMIPHAGFKLREPSALLKEVKGRKVILLVEDRAAYKCMREIAEALQETANSIRLIQFGSDEVKIDLSDYVRKFYSIKEINNGLSNI